MALLKNKKFKGIVLAGGVGTRLSPLTKVQNKQLLPIYDKPMIFYSISILMLAKIRNLLIICNNKDLSPYNSLLGNGSRLGMNIEYKVQLKPNGLPEAFIIGEQFIGKSNVVLILGDNFFYGQSLTENINKTIKKKARAKIFLYKVRNPESYGIAKVNKNKIIEIKEKPKIFLSDLAVTGLYCFDSDVVDYSKQLKKSMRGELEMIDLIKIYLKKKQLSFFKFGRGAAWLDTGSYKGLLDAGNFVNVIEERQGLKIACLEEISLKNKWINKKKIKQNISFYGKCDYSEYLKKIIQ